MSQFQAGARFFFLGAHVAVSGRCKILFSWGPCRSFRQVQDSCLHITDRLWGPPIFFFSGSVCCHQGLKWPCC